MVEEVIVCSRWDSSNGVNKNNHGHRDDHQQELIKDRIRRTSAGRSGISPPIATSVIKRRSPTPVPKIPSSKTTNNFTSSQHSKRQLYSILGQLENKHDNHDPKKIITPSTTTTSTARARDGDRQAVPVVLTTSLPNIHQQAPSQASIMTIRKRRPCTADIAASRKQEKEKKLRSIIAKIVQREHTQRSQFSQEAKQMESKPSNSKAINGRTKESTTSSSPLNHHQQQSSSYPTNKNQIYQPLQSSLFELDNTTLNDQERRRGLVRPVETLREKIAKKDKLIHEQLKLIEELYSRIETLSKLNNHTTTTGADDSRNNHKYENGQSINVKCICNEDGHEECKKKKNGDNGKARRRRYSNFILSFDAFFTDSGNISPLTIEKVDGDIGP